MLVANMDLDEKSQKPSPQEESEPPRKKRRSKFDMLVANLDAGDEDQNKGSRDVNATVAFPTTDDTVGMDDGPVAVAVAAAVSASAQSREEKRRLKLEKHKEQRKRLRDDKLMKKRAAELELEKARLAKEKAEIASLKKAEQKTQELQKKLAAIEAEKLALEKKKLENERKRLEDERKEVLENKKRAVESARLVAEKQKEEMKAKEAELKAKLEAEAEAKAKVAKAKAEADAKAAKLKRTNSSSEKLQEEWICCICQDLLVKTMSLKCGHVACEMCLLDWLKRSQSCPSCRKAHDGSDPIPNRILDNTIDLIAKDMLSDEDMAERKERLEEWEEWDKKRKADAAAAPAASSAAFAPAAAARPGFAPAFPGASAFGTAVGSAVRGLFSSRPLFGGFGAAAAPILPPPPPPAPRPFEPVAFGALHAPAAFAPRLAPAASARASSSSSAPTRSGKPRCHYGASCYQQNAAHRARFSHPDDSDEDSDSDSSSESDSDSEDDAKAAASDDASKYRVDHATNGYGSCVACGDGIFMHLLQITDTRKAESYHVRCFATRHRRRSFDPTKFDNYSRLRASKKSEFRRLYNAPDL